VHSFPAPQQSPINQPTNQPTAPRALAEPGIGGELMSSTLVGGAPEECAAALTHPSSSSSLLGPAARVTPLARGDGWQLLRFDLAPLAGSAAALACAPRCAVVRVTRRRRADGIRLMMFSSVPAAEARRHLAGGGCDGGNGSGVLSSGGGGGLVGVLQRVAAALWRPVLMEVSGGYSIVGLSECGGSSNTTSSSTTTSSSSNARRQTGTDGGSGRPATNGGGAAGGGASPKSESMVTGIFKADLGGWLSSCHAGAAVAAGAAERGWRATLVGAFVDSMLMAVPLAKQEVESGRALVRERDWGL
jgi:hypothetical protein